MNEMPAEATPGEVENETQQDKHLTFALGEEVFGIHIGYVAEIVGLQKISAIPETPDYVKGIINLRGNIVPVVDMRLRFKKNPSVYTDRTCIIVIHIDAFTVGLIVDSVDEVITIPKTAVAPAPSRRSGYQNRYIQGIGKVGEEICLLLDCERLFMSDEKQALHQIKM